MIPCREFFTAFASAAVKSSHEMALLSKKPISRPVAHGPSAQLRLSQRGEDKLGRAPTASSELQQLGLSPIGTALAPGSSDAPRQRSRSAGTRGASPAAASSGSSAPSPPRRSSKTRPRAPGCPPLPAQMGLRVIGLKDPV